MLNNNIKLTILGGDLRQLAVARRLSGLGFETAVWGLGVCEEEIGDAVRCTSWEDAVNESKAVILPLPASSDGVRVNCPMNTSEQLKMKKLIETVGAGIPIIGGRFTPSFKCLAEEKNVKVIDYFQSEVLQIQNAIPTAEGAVAIAMNELPVTLCNANVAVVGYGRIGKTLAHLLDSLGAHVTVAARKNVDLAWVRNFRYKPLKIEVKNGVSTLAELGSGYDVIFNTVPYWLFDDKVLSGMSKNTLIIDLASAPGGVDTRAAGEHGIKVIWALSLPGKYSPFTAGDIICDSVLDILEREGIM